MRGRCVGAASSSAVHNARAEVIRPGILTPKPPVSSRPSLGLATDLCVAPPSLSDSYAPSSLLDLSRDPGAIIRSPQVVSVLSSSPLLSGRGAARLVLHHLAAGVPLGHRAGGGGAVARRPRGIMRRLLLHLGGGAAHGVLVGFLGVGAGVRGRRSALGVVGALLLRL